MGTSPAPPFEIQPRRRAQGAMVFGTKQTLLAAGLAAVGFEMAKAGYGDSAAVWLPVVGAAATYVGHIARNVAVHKGWTHLLPVLVAAFLLTGCAQKLSVLPVEGDGWKVALFRYEGAHGDAQVIDCTNIEDDDPLIEECSSTRGGTISEEFGSITQMVGEVFKFVLGFFGARGGA